MPRLSTALLVVGVCAIAIAAVVAAVLPEDDRPSQGSAAATTQSTVSEDSQSPAALERDVSGLETLESLVTELAAARVTGTLAIAGSTDCRVFTVSLPYLRAKELAGLEACAFPVSSESRLSSVTQARQPHGNLAARCREGQLVVFDPVATPGLPRDDQVAAGSWFDGCGPAWKPDGTLTYVLGGQVVSVDPTCLDDPACPEVILSRATLGADLRSLDPSMAFATAGVKQLTWTGNRRFVAIIVVRSQGGARENLVGLVDGGRLVGLLRPPATELSLVRTSPKGTYVAVRAPAEEALWVVHTEGGKLRMERFPPWAPPAPTAFTRIAWSPDESWTAISSRRSVYLFKTGKSNLGYFGLPVAASDVLWPSG